AYLIAKVLKKRGNISGEITELLLILIVPVSMSPRTWFASTQGDTADIAAACYPFLLILGPFLLWRFLSSASAGPHAVRITFLIAVAYGLARLAGGYGLLSDR